MAVTRTSKGAFNSNTAGFTAAFGAGATAGDLGLLLTETANEAVAAIANWTVLNSVSIGSAGVAGGTRQTIQYRQGITSAEITSGIAVGDSGDHQIAALLTYSGFDTNSPFLNSGQFTGSPATTAVSLNNFLTTLQAGDIVLACIATDRDSATLSSNAASSWTGPTGTDNGFILNGSTASGAGGGVIVSEFAVTADYTGQVNFSCSITSSIWVGWLVVIRSPIRPPFFNRQARLGYMML